MECRRPRGTRGAGGARNPGDPAGSAGLGCPLADVAHPGDDDAHDRPGDPEPVEDDRPDDGEPDAGDDSDTPPPDDDDPTASDTPDDDDDDDDKTKGKGVTSATTQGVSSGTGPSLGESELKELVATAAIEAVEALFKHLGIQAPPSKTSPSPSDPLVTEIQLLELDSPE